MLRITMKKSDAETVSNFKLCMEINKRVHDLQFNPYPPIKKKPYDIMKSECFLVEIKALTQVEKL